MVITNGNLLALEGSAVLCFVRVQPDLYLCKLAACRESKSSVRHCSLTVTFFTALKLNTMTVINPLLPETFPALLSPRAGEDRLLA